MAIKEIVLEIDEKDIKLSLEEAKKLFKELSEIFINEKKEEVYALGSVSIPPSFFRF